MPAWVRPKGQHLPVSQLALHELNVTCTTALRKDDIPPIDGETEAQRECVVSRLMGRQVAERVTFGDH